MVVVKWSVSLPSTPTIRIQIPLKTTVFSVKFVFEKNENKQKEAGLGPFLTLSQRAIEYSAIILGVLPGFAVQSFDIRLFKYE